MVSGQQHLDPLDQFVAGPGDRELRSSQMATHRRSHQSESGDPLRRRRPQDDRGARSSGPAIRRRRAGAWPTGDRQRVPARLPGLAVGALHGDRAHLSDHRTGPDLPNSARCRALSRRVQRLTRSGRGQPGRWVAYSGSGVEGRTATDLAGAIFAGAALEGCPR